MSGTGIYQGMGDRIVNKNHILNDGWCRNSTKLIKIEDSSLCDGLHNVPGLLEVIPHEVLSTPTLIAGVVQTTVGLVIMILPIY